MTDAAGVNQLGDIVGTTQYPLPHGFVLPTDKIDSANKMNETWAVRPNGWAIRQLGAPVADVDAMSSSARGLTTDWHVVGASSAFVGLGYDRFWDYSVEKLYGSASEKVFGGQKPSTDFVAFNSDRSTRSNF